MTSLRRRTALALLFGAAAHPAWTGELRRVLFIGNSFTAEHDIPSLFAEIAAQSGHELLTHRLTRNGASLTHQLDTGLAAIAELHPDVLVLQDHSTVALTEEARQRSIEAINRFGEHGPPVRVLFETWPRRAGHALYRRRGMPSDPGAMMELVSGHYARWRGSPGWFVAPVGQAWRLAEGIDLYASDGYHANRSGAWLSALLLARTAGLAPSRPKAPHGVVHPAELTLLASAASHRSSLATSSGHREPLIEQ